MSLVNYKIGQTEGDIWALVVAFYFQLCWNIYLIFFCNSLNKFAKRIRFLFNSLNLDFWCSKNYSFPPPNCGKVYSYVWKMLSPLLNLNHILLFIIFTQYFIFRYFTLIFSCERFQICNPVLLKFGMAHYIGWIK